MIIIMITPTIRSKVIIGLEIVLVLFDGGHHFADQSDQQFIFHGLVEECHWAHYRDFHEDFE